MGVQGMSLSRGEITALALVALLFVVLVSSLLWLPTPEPTTYWCGDTQVVVHGDEIPNPPCPEGSP